MNQEQPRGRLSIEQVRLIKKWIVQAGRIAQAGQANAVDWLKRDNTPVSDADLLVERYLLDRICEEFPQHQVIAEESGRVGVDSDWVWAIDPIDGTKSYLLKLPVWGVAIGILYRGTPAAGFFYMPVSRDLFWGWDQGAYWNNRRLPNRSGKDYNDSMLSLAVHSHAHEEHTIRYPRLQSYGSTIAHQAFLAAGVAVGALARRVNLWDLAAGIAILNQVGCRAEYLSGKPICFEDLMDGRKTQEEVLATRTEWMDRLRGDIL